MMKSLFVSLPLLAMISCSGYFSQGGYEKNAAGMNRLALADGSGYISTDQYNEITPFIFKNTNNGKKFLFFASDRDGSYDIYYAEMNAGGKFAHPVKMTNAINSIDNENSPVLFYDPTGLFISFLHEMTGQGQVTLQTYEVDPADFNLIRNTGGTYNFVTNCRLSLLAASGSSYLEVCQASSNWDEYGWDGNWSPSMTGVLPLQDNTLTVNSVSGYQTLDIDLSQTANWYLFSVLVNGKSQIYAGGTTNYWGRSFYPAVPYASSFNDADACVDPDDFKVYFASDRYGKGNYDLYRYNIVRYDTVLSAFLSQPVITNSVLNLNGPAELYWQAVPGATHFRVLFSGDGGLTYSVTNDTTSLFFIDSVPLTYGSYYYKVEAVNVWGESDSDPVFVNLVS